jgi:signal transduction histidine kinase
LPAFMEQMVEEFRVGHPDYSLIFQSDCTRIVRVDLRLIRQITANLISNAIKYSSVGSEVFVALHCSSEQIVLAVQDRGIGIPEAEQSRLFNAFQRASNVGDVAGTGLGLAIVQHAVNSHGGTIQLESDIDMGTKITVRIPG